MKSDLTLKIAMQMTRQSDLVKLPMAGQSDDKHLGEVIKGKENQFQSGNQFVIGVTGTLKAIRTACLALVVIDYTNKKPFAPRGERNLLQMSQT